MELSIIHVISNILYAIIGAGAIYFGIEYFKSGKYFIFGLYMMAMVSSAAGIFDIFLGG